MRSSVTKRLGRLATTTRLEASLTVGLALVVGILNVLGIAKGQVVSATTLGVLALLCWDVYDSRQRLHSLGATVREFTRQAGRSGSGAPAPLVAIGAAAREEAATTKEVAAEIGVIGVTLNRTIRSWMSDLEQGLRAGARIRVAVIDPTERATSEAARRNGLPGAAAMFAHRVQPTVDLLRHLSSIPGVSGRIEVRFLPFVPGYGMTFMDDGTGDGVVIVDLYSHSPSGPEALITVTARRQPALHDHFRTEFERLWESGRITESDAARAKKPSTRAL